jgi:hypothetical protein
MLMLRVSTMCVPSQATVDEFVGHCSLAACKRLRFLSLPHMQILAASQHHCSLLLQRGLAAWRQYAAHGALKAAARQRAEQHRDSKLAAAALAGLAARVEVGRVKRQRLFAAAMHRRVWLLRRACRAWRYAFVLA